MIDLETDLIAMLSTDDFAVEALFNAQTVVAGLFDRVYVEPSGAAGHAPVFRCREADVASPVGKTLRIGTTTYTIRAARPDGNGLTELQLEE